MKTLGPNTNAPSTVLFPSMILCCGEDPAELCEAVKQASGTPPRLLHEYRCFRFLEHQARGLVWTGIGTGCLEPLLFEILRPGIIRQLILIGTAGRYPHSSAALGQAYWIERAAPFFSAVDAFYHQQPFTPRWSQPLPPGLASASMTSSDLYYNLPAQQCNDTRRHPATDLIDMECAQFYLLCAAGSREDSLEFGAVKGPANNVGEGETQVKNSMAVLQACWRHSMALLAASQP